MTVKFVGFFRENGRLPKITDNPATHSRRILGRRKSPFWVFERGWKSLVFLNLVISAGSYHHPVDVRKDWDLGFYLTVLVDLVINHAADKEIGRSNRVESWKVRRRAKE